MFLTIILWSTAATIQTVEAVTLFEDGFESGDASAWTGIGGYYLGIYDGKAHDGAFCAIGMSRSYVYESVSAPELYTRGYFTDPHDAPLITDGDHLTYLLFQAADGSTLAHAGYRMVGSAIRWSLTLRQGTSYIDVYASTSPVSPNADPINFEGYYCLELHWKKDTTMGGADLWVNGVKVCSSWGKNTAVYGDAKSVQVGMVGLNTSYDHGPSPWYPEILFDCITIGTTYIGPEPYVFNDGFGSGSLAPPARFGAWTDTAVNGGEARSISWSRTHHNATSARFNTNGGGGYEGAYAYKTIKPMRTIYARGYFYVSQSGIANIGDRMFFILLKNGSQNVAYVGWKKGADGTVRWCVTMKTVTGYSDLYTYGWSNAQLPSPVSGRWYCVELLYYWQNLSIGDYGYVVLWVNGQRAVDTYPVDTYPPTVVFVTRDVSTVQFGLAETYAVGPSIVYTDCCIIDHVQIGPEVS